MWNVVAKAIAVKLALRQRLVLVGLPVWLGIANLACALHAAERPNVVFFLVDDLGYMDIGVYNPDTFYETPNVDRLAASGVRFTNGYAANPVCSPTRFSILTGKYPTRAGCTNYFSGKKAGRFKPAPLNDQMPLAEVTLAEAFKEGGYATFFAGKWHLGPGEAFWPEAQGFDVNMGGSTVAAPMAERSISPLRQSQAQRWTGRGTPPDRLASETVQFIRDHKDEPFLAYLAFYSVHTPLIGRPDLVEKYQRKAASISGQEFGPEEQNLPENQPRQVRLLQKHAVYAAMVEAMDLAVGKVLDALDEAGVAENTVVCFMSDNGGLSTSEGSPTSNLPLRAGKGWLYEGGIREPYIVRWPTGAKPGLVCDVPVISTDFYPTLLDIADLPPRPEQTLDGVSLVPLLTQSGNIQPRQLYWHYPHYSNQGGFPGGAVRDGDWKLLERYEDGRAHLYNLADDLSEQHDRAEAEPERVASMRAALHSWYKTVDAQFLEPLRPDGPQPWRP
ncbi:MAG: sulfatase [Planctomycetaceae bacterium]